MDERTNENINRSPNKGLCLIGKGTRMWTWSKYRWLKSTDVEVSSHAHIIGQVCHPGSQSAPPPPT